jgi:hypothetical protein
LVGDKYAEKEQLLKSARLCMYSFDAKAEDFDWSMFEKYNLRTQSQTKIVLSVIDNLENDWLEYFRPKYASRPSKISCV